MKAMIFGKFAGLLLVAILLLLGLDQITSLVQERQGRHQSAVDSVASSLAGSQTLLGPLVHVRCTEEWNASDNEKRPVQQRREFTLVAAPSSLAASGSSQVEARARGLHATQVYTYKSHITAQWPNLKAVAMGRQNTGSKVQCDAPVLMLAVSDARGIRQAEVKINGAVQEVQAGTPHPTYPRGIQASLPNNIQVNAPLVAEVELELLGTESLNFVPVGNATQVNLTSNWPHPSFTGQFLPSERNVSEKGFEATWRISALASNAQQSVLSQGALCNGNSMGSSIHDSPRDAVTATAAVAGSTDCVETLGLSFIDPINTYSLSDRATKYGLLFIVLTFVAVGLFEFMRGLRVHPVQYFLVGAAISIFFLLLVSLSEHIAFHLAYAIAASACVLLLSYYASHMLHSWKRGLPFGAGIAALYGLLYMLLQLEQTALVVGALALFSVLAAVMMLTRKVDWYSRLQSPPISTSAAQPEAP
ncbi:cell envelope integrity protein CreD [Rhodoferax saidenbachensis]|uniref:Inner membrane protein n=1 Tax=Rhodoferax saidenbachensis TaxID=1484693 RepID=A0ABU1ZLF5_9BURK|nr:cell envelope integrity protein CreD [Rhodoferax saidenbachensis]MDR7306369.1 inner membrane protein [Rhodoferax saidenbachensis]